MSLAKPELNKLFFYVYTYTQGIVKYDVKKWNARSIVHMMLN